MNDDASDPAVDRSSISASTSSIVDRTASDVFASLAADGPVVDTDAILDGASPDELIERTNDPEPASSIDSTLFDEAELTELILPDRHADGTFRWIETSESAPHRILNRPSDRSRTRCERGRTPTTMDSTTPQPRHQLQ